MNPKRMEISRTRQLAMAELILEEIASLGFCRAPIIPPPSPALAELLKSWHTGYTVWSKNDQEKIDQQQQLGRWLEMQRARNNAIAEIERRLRTLFWMHRVFARAASNEKAALVAEHIRKEWDYYVSDHGLDGVNDSGDCVVEMTIRGIIQQGERAKGRAA